MHGEKTEQNNIIKNVTRKYGNVSLAELFFGLPIKQYDEESNTKKGN